MTPLSGSLTCVLFIAGAAPCAGDNASTPKRGRLGEVGRSLAKEEYIHRAYVLGKGIRPPERFTGAWCTWYADGQLRREVTLVNGSSHGPCKEWDAKGRLVASGEYRNGDPFDGSFREWYYLVLQRNGIFAFNGIAWRVAARSVVRRREIVPAMKSEGVGGGELVRPDRPWASGSGTPALGVIRDRL